MNYSPKVLDHFLHPRHLGTISDKEADAAKERVVHAEAGHLLRGDALRLSLKINLADDRIADAKFQNLGTGMPIASSSQLCSTIIGKTLGEALKITAEDLDKDLDGLPELKNRQPVLVLDALDAAARKFRGQPPRDKGNPGELPLCSCFQVPESIVEKHIRLRGLATIEDVTDATRAGGGCHTCHPELEDVLERCARGDYKFHISPDEYEAAQRLYAVPPPTADELAKNLPPPALPRTLAGPDRSSRMADDGFIYPDKSPVAEMASLQSAKKRKSAKPWAEMTPQERDTRIKEVLEYDLRPAIRTDGGDIQFVELSGNRVRVTLHGHCKSCHSATSTLKLGVEKRLQEAVWPELEVEEVF